MTGFVKSASCDSDKYRAAKSVTGLSTEERIVTVKKGGSQKLRGGP
jgi:hypothetical protein